VEYLKGKRERNGSKNAPYFASHLEFLGINIRFSEKAYI